MFIVSKHPYFLKVNDVVVSVGEFVGNSGNPFGTIFGYKLQSPGGWVLASIS